MSFMTKTIAERTLQGQRQSVQENNFRVYIHNRGGAGQLAGLLVTDNEYPHRPAFAVISKVLEDFTSKFPQSTFHDPSAISFPLGEYMKNYQDPNLADPILQINKELENTKDVLFKTIEQMLERGERLENLVDRSAALSTQSKMFYKTAKKQNSCCIVM